MDRKGKSNFEKSWFQHVLMVTDQANLNIDLWVGHDVITGEAALCCAEQRQKRSAIFHHMKYLDYGSVKSEEHTQVVEKTDLQEEVLKKADLVFPIGPLLRKSAEQVVGDNNRVCMLVPGFPEGVSRSETSHVSAISFGRLNPEDDFIKQGRLSLVAFSKAIENARQGQSSAFEDARFFLIGIEKSEIKSAQAIANEKAESAFNLICLPYLNERKKLFENLGRANLALMLSWHEGFGLTGWEAIGAKIPLIISQRTGLFRLIKETLGPKGLGCLHSVFIRGNFESEDNFHESDLSVVSETILRVANNFEEAKQGADDLKAMLEAKLGCTWADTATSFLEKVLSDEIAIRRISEKKTLETTTSTQNFSKFYDNQKSTDFCNDAFELCKKAHSNNTEVKVLVTRGQRTSSSTIEPWSYLLRNKVKVKYLFPDPSGVWAHWRKMELNRFLPSHRDTDVPRKARTALEDLLGELKDDESKEIRINDFPQLGILIITDEGLFFQPLLRRRGEDSPIYYYVRDTDFYEFYDRMFELAWNVNSKVLL